MGLLDDLMGQLAGNATARNVDPSESAPSRGSGGLGTVMVALLPVVLGMLRGREQQAGSGQSAGGGLSDILGQVIGGGRGGGLGGLLDQFQAAGFGEQARSWVGTGQNMPIPPDALERVFGRDGIAEIARRAGVSEQDASRGLSQLMPEVVDRVTPQGEMPPAASLLASVDALAKRLGA